jgi:hypothetical protein
MRYATAFTEELAAALHRHLQRQDGQEDLCFALWRPSRGASRLTALITELVLPRRGDRRVHGNASFTARYFERALGAAMAARGGLALLHSHPGAMGWQGISHDDAAAEGGHAGAAVGATGLPLLGLTLATGDGSWSARAWERSAPRTYQPVWCDLVRVVGRRLSISTRSAALPRESREELDRTVAAWGEAVQRRIESLTVGIVGLGSVGSIVCEMLARIGAGKIVLIDFDRAERVNRDRVLHLYDSDVRDGRLKIEIAAAAARRAATAPGFEAVAVPYSVIEEEGFMAALDCDLLFSCVDRPWPRSALNFIAYAHLVPVVDGGIRLVQSVGGGVRRGDVRAHSVGPARACLECLGQFAPEDVALERDGYLDDPTYIASLPAGHHLKARQNVFAFSLMAAALEAMHMLSMLVAPAGLEFPAQAYHFVPGSLDDVSTACKARCPYRAMTGTGDHAPISVTRRHDLAERVRLL